jgi:hypothetical protein
MSVNPRNRFNRTSKIGAVEGVRHGYIRLFHTYVCPFVDTHCDYAPDLDRPVVTAAGFFRCDPQLQSCRMRVKRKYCADR